MAECQALRQLAGLGPESQKVGRQSEVECDPSGREPRGTGLAVGREELAAQQKRAGGVLPADCRTAGTSKSHYGYGIQTGPHRVRAVEARDSLCGARAGGV